MQNNYPKIINYNIGHNDINDKRNGINRNVIIISHNNNLDNITKNLLVNALIQSIREAFRQIPQILFDKENGINHINVESIEQISTMPTHIYNKFGVQLDAYAVANNIYYNDLLQNSLKHFDIVFVRRDLNLNNGRLNFIYGYGPHPYSIVSTKRFDLNREIGKAMLAILTSHEFMHNIGMVDRNYNTGNTDITRLHCDGRAGDCIMEQVDAPGCKSLQEHTNRLLNTLVKRQTLLCPYCTEEAYNRKITYEKNGLVW